MQNQKTEPNPELDDLPLLNAEEERLVELIAGGEDNSAAYLRAYNATGYSKAALHVRACRKVAEPKIQQHLRALRSVGLAKAQLSLAERLKDEMAFAQRAENAGNFGAAGGANDRVNKLLGLYVEKIQDVTSFDPVETIKEIARTQPELAASLAREHGIEWTAPTSATTH